MKKYLIIVDEEKDRIIFGEVNTTDAFVVKRISQLEIIHKLIETLNEIKERHSHAQKTTNISS